MKLVVVDAPVALLVDERIAGLAVCPLLGKYRIAVEWLAADVGAADLYSLRIDGLHKLSL